MGMETMLVTQNAASSPESEFAIHHFFGIVSWVVPEKGPLNVCVCLSVWHCLLDLRKNTQSLLYNRAGRIFIIIKVLIHFIYQNLLLIV